jgi:L-serine dehydratase
LRAAAGFLSELRSENLLPVVERVKIDYTVPFLNRKGHATDLAVMLGLAGKIQEYIPVENIDAIIKSLNQKKTKS